MEGKIVLCDAAIIGTGAVAAGAVGSIMQNGFYKDMATSFILPSSVLSMSDGAHILEYLNSNRYFCSSSLGLMGKACNWPHIWPLHSGL